MLYRRIETLFMQRKHFRGGLPMALILFLAMTAGMQAARAQLRPAGLAQLQAKEDSLRADAEAMVNALDGAERLAACHRLIPGLVSALQVPGSFYYPFDSLQQVSVLYPPDSSFRIFSWALALNDAQYRFYGALQLRDNTLKLCPLSDNSRRISALEDTITGPSAWIGALYYRLIETRRGALRYYTLFGWRGYDFQSNSKLLEVLTFSEGKPVFGAPLFSFRQDSVPGRLRRRFLLTYKRDGNATLNYDDSLRMIVYDHLVSVTGEPQKAYTLVPDGTYEGFRWEDGLWVHHERIFDETSAKPPVPEPVDFKKNLLEKDTLRPQGP